MNGTIRLGTRSSQLALRQSNQIAELLRNNGLEVELVEISTAGDRSLDSLAQIGGQGLFTKQLQQALLRNEVDMAVHSLKDLPTEQSGSLEIAAVPKRENVQDALIVRRSWQHQVKSLEDLPPSTRIGTGSVRRRAQLLHLRKDLAVTDIRGNVDTRLGKLDKGDFDAIVLACAGLNRLGLQSEITFAFEQKQMAPAVGQGALGLEIRTDDVETRKAVQLLNEPKSFAEAVAERAMLGCLNAGCMASVGAISGWEGDNLSLTGVVLCKNGDERIAAKSTAAIDQAETLGTEVAHKLLDQGANRLLS